ncbi:Neprilysin-2 [Folsomia candida]|uniref:Neprilysin-2 n=1 Tax=Folsomia candida TaxID=158441 RepID=A0A226EPN4_FOLCA|nr:Neprilysin-2 [Folsomia candida]
MASDAALLGIDETDEEPVGPSSRTRPSTTKEEFIHSRRRKQSGTSVRTSKLDTGNYWANYYKSRRKLHPHHHPSSNLPSLPDSSNTTINSEEVSETESDSPPQINIVDDLERTDWEHWWVKSPLWRRLDVLVLVLLFVMGMVQLAASIYFLLTYNSDKTVDPYVCNSPNCRRLSKRLNESINNNVSPCEDFYQFVCGNYIDEHDTGEFAGTHSKICDMDNARLEFGKQNVLGLRDEGPKGAEFDSFKVQIAKLFGNLSELNSGSSLASMAIDMTHSIGDFGFFKFDLAGNPYLLIQTLDLPWKKQFNDSTMIKDMMHVIFPELTEDRLLKLSIGALEVLDTLNNIRVNDIKCTTSQKDPFDIRKVLEDYVGMKEFKEEYSNTEVDEYVNKLKNCWDKFIPINATILITDKNQAIVGFWILRIVMWSLKEIDSDAFYLLQKVLGSIEYFQEISLWRSKSIDFQCFQSLTRSLGYLPVHRYFERLGLDADQYYRNIETFLRRRVIYLAKFWANATLLPHIDNATREEGMKLLTNLDPFNLMSNIPTQQDLSVENSKEFGNLQLGDEHLQNVFNGKEFTLRRAKEWWNRQHDPLHVLLWNSNTFKLEDPYYNVRPVIEYENAIFTPLSFYLEPFDSDMLAVRNAGSTLVSVRAVLNMLLEYTEEDKIKRRLKNESWTPSPGASEKECWLQIYDKQSKTVRTISTTMKDMHTYQETPHVFKYRKTFGNVIALKVAHSDSEDREFISKTPFWELSNKSKRWVRSKKLQGFESYTEEQIFFMSAVRNFCRQKLEKDDDGFYIEYITSINAALQQMQEFAAAWKCPMSKMNPPFKCF